MDNIKKSSYVFVLLIFLGLFLSGCQEKDINAVPTGSDSDAVPEIYSGEVEGVKQEIDYWYNKGGREIGMEHYSQLKERLDNLAGKISEEDRLEYLRRLNAIQLVDDPAYLANTPTSAANENSDENRKRADLEGCEREGAVQFTFSPMRVGEIEMIQPIGLMIGGHVTPIDHGYYNSNKWSSPGERKIDEFVDVLAPAEGVVTVQSMPAEFATTKIGDYRLVIYHTCTFYSIYIHVNQLSEKLMEVADTGKKVKVDAGEVIGRAPGFDFSVHNSEVFLSGFLVPGTYNSEEWKIHTVDMFEVFTEPIKSQLLGKNVRQVEPRGGKIDYDIDGKLIGNWFEENTNGYLGKKEYDRLPGYWKTHVAFAPDAYDHSLFVISLGDFAGEAKQFAAKGNSPDPAAIGVESGIIKYELVGYDFKTDKDEHWDRIHYAKVVKTVADDVVQGVVLVQMLEKQKIKLEVFPGKTGSEVNGFTDAAKVYVR